MAHLHSIYDNDAHFCIDPVTRRIKEDTSLKTLLAQGDHNSERFTFELPRIIEGHDMSLCDKVEIHYLNGTNPGVYEVDDLQISPNSDDVVIFSWLISNNATQLAATLAFAIKLACTSDGVVDYAYNTLPYEKVNVGKSINNGEVIIQEYADILAQWKQELSDAATNVKVDATLTVSGKPADAAVVGKKFSSLSEEIADIPSGKDGKSAYQYAQDGGYTGTETEFVEKLSAEIPTVDSTLTKSGEAADAKAVGDQLSSLNEANEAQDKLIANKLDASALPTAVNDALEQAKASGEFDGADGADGQPGENGITPTIGDNGNWYLGEADTGKPSRGEEGPQGPRGETGLQGPIGPQGETGATGPAGADGAPGKDGAPGADGQDGITPTIGENGNWYLGDTDTGKPSRGEEGPQGPQGETGLQGPAGPAGANGADGAQGPQGPIGPAGTDGKSAYQYAVEGGYSGTEAEFAEKLAEEIHPGSYPVVTMTADTAALAPNIYYKWGEVASLTITLEDPADTTITNEYCFEFVSGSTATMLTVPDTIRWAQEPSIDTGKTYQVSILNGIGVIVGA